MRVRSEGKEIWEKRRKRNMRVRSEGKKWGRKEGGET